MKISKFNPQTDLDRHPSEFGALPFICMPIQGDMRDIFSYKNCGETTIVIATWDGDDIRTEGWWNDPCVLGPNVGAILPGIDMMIGSKEECVSTYPDMQSAINSIRTWWLTAKCRDYQMFREWTSYRVPKGSIK
jgi:hypothetical protein